MQLKMFAEISFDVFRAINLLLNLSKDKISQRIVWVGENRISLETDISLVILSINKFYGSCLMPSFKSSV